MRNVFLIVAMGVFCLIGWRIMGRLDGFLNGRAKEKTMPLDEQKEIEKED